MKQMFTNVIIECKDWKLEHLFEHADDFDPPCRPRGSWTWVSYLIFVCLLHNVCMRVWTDMYWHLLCRDSLSFKVPGSDVEQEFPLPEGAQPGDVLEIRLGEAPSGETGEKYQEGGHCEDESTEETFTFGDVKITLKQRLESHSGKSDGTGCYVWNAGKYLAEYLQSDNTPVNNLRVLELGAGSGVVGIVASLCGAKKAILTDKEEVVELLVENIHLNNIRSKCEAAALPWGETVGEPVDTVIGADLLYDSKNGADGYRPLVDTIISSQATKVILGVRWRKPDLEKAFFELMKQEGFDITLLHGCGPDWQEYCGKESSYMKQLISAGGTLVPLEEVTEEQTRDMTDAEDAEWNRLQMQIYSFVRADNSSIGFTSSKLQRVE